MKKQLLLLFNFNRITLQLLLPGLLLSWGAGVVMAGDFKGPKEWALETTDYNSSNKTNLVQLITGKVVDANGDPVPGATILVEGTIIGTATDIDGNFSLDVPEDAVLLVSFIGYKSLSIEVGSQTSFRLTLTEDASALDEVVVVGYG